MPLPDASRLATIGEDGWARLAERLRAIGVGPDLVHEVARLAPESRALPRQPLRLWRARRRNGPAGFALRLLFLCDTVTPSEASEALGPTLETCLLAGLVVSSADGVRSPFRLHYANELLLLADELVHGGDAVMGAAETTGELASMAFPASPKGSALDLGCGAGTLALLLAGRVPRVVGTDVNARAITMSRVNAALNLLKVDWRQGDLFAPVAGEAFDLVVSQPPFIARPPGFADATFLFGGERGDELPLRLLAELAPALALGGRAVLLVMWPEVAADDLEARVGGALSNRELGVTLFVGPPLDLDDWCTINAARLAPGLGSEFDRTAISQREHLERIGVVALRMTATVIERASHGRGWISSVPITSIERLRHDHIDAAVGARSLLAREGEALLAAKLRPPEGATFTDDAAGRVHVRFEDGSPWRPLEIAAASYTLVAALEEAPDVRAAVEVVHARTRAPREAILRAVEQALTHGVVEIA